MVAPTICIYFQIWKLNFKVLLRLLSHTKNQYDVVYLDDFSSIYTNQSEQVNADN